MIAAVRATTQHSEQHSSQSAIGHMRDGSRPGGGAVGRKSPVTGSFDGSRILGIAAALIYTDVRRTSHCEDFRIRAFVPGVRVATSMAEVNHY